MNAFRRLQQFGQRLSGKKMVRNTLWMLLARGLQIAIQSFYFVAITRTLGPTKYGGFMAILALVWTVVPFASWGWPNILVRNVSRNPASFRQAWGNALLVTACLGTVWVVAIVAIARWILPDSLPIVLVLYVAISQLLFDRLTTIAGRAFQALQRLKITAVLNTFLRMRNLVAALIFISLGQTDNLELWGQIFCASAAVVTAIGLGLVHTQLGAPALDLAAIRAEVLRGFYFSVGLSSQTIYNNIDKAMLAKLGTLSATGAYAAGYRLVEIAFTPVMAITAVAYAKFFQQGESGIRGSLALAARLLPIASGYSAIVSLVLLFGAPLVPFILGEDYAGVVNVVRWLAVIPLLRTLHFFAADTLTGAGFQGMRTAMQVGIAIFNAGLNLWWIPLFSWRGAIGSSLASDALLAIGLWMLVRMLARQEAATGEPADPLQDKVEAGIS
ncbi:oligosaccharide flippase family protein [Synechococcus sp. PCC 7336]|uniref:oligosaccharide flippase family protein n=1 Tax=Synechococcus sp. PCC 7336 TaxID=195250 RepID=UPI0003450882|nr:oligosaccharide flippase family protein [Synechococcus sp. PCC 7336]